MAESESVAVWNVPFSDKMYKIEFEHGTTTGKRVVRVNGREIIRHDWMFKLVGKEIFEVNQVRCAITIEAVAMFAYEYTLTVGGKAYEKFREQQKKALQVWHVHCGDEDARICLDRKDDYLIHYTMEQQLFCNLHVKQIITQKCFDISLLEKDTMDIWVNGSKVNTTGEFVEDGTETHFEVGKNVCYIKSQSSGKRNVGLIHQLYVNGQLVEDVGPS